MLFFIRQSVNVDLIPPRRDLGQARMDMAG